MVCCGVSVAYIGPAHGQMQTGYAPSALTVCFLQARTLMTLTYAFYTDPVSFLHVHNFNHSPAEFNFAEMAKELGIGSDTSLQ